MESKSTNRIYIIVIVILLLALIGMSTLLFLSAKASSNKTADESFFDTQTAMVTGTVKNVGNNMITIENSKGIVKELPMSPAFTVMTSDEKGTVTPSSDLSKVVTSKQYSINLGIGAAGTLEVITVIPAISNAPGTIAPELTSPPPAPPVTSPKAATPSARTVNPEPANTETTE